MDELLLMVILPRECYVLSIKTSEGQERLILESKIDRGKLAESKTEVNSEEKLRGFRVDVTLVLVGLFLALGVQSVIQFVETVSPHISPYFYLGVGVVSLFMVLLCLNLAARLAGFVRPDMKKRQARRGGK
jgi:hypothetical protein